MLKTPAKMFCQVQTKHSVVPDPPGGGPVGPLTLANHPGGVFPGFFCYKVKCPKDPAVIPAARDQFGSRPTLTIPPTSPRLYCAPASPGGAFLDAD